MKIEHAAIYVNDLEKAKYFFQTYLGAKSNEGYYNPKTEFRSYFCHLMMEQDWKL